MGTSLNIITPKQLEEKTGWAQKTQANMRSQGILPYAKLGRKVVYFVEDIEALLKAHMVNAKTEA
jgi:hypothetical protein